MSARDPQVDDAFVQLEGGLMLWDKASGKPMQPAYFQEVCGSTRIMRLGDTELLVTITSPATRTRSKPPPGGGSGAPLM